MPSPSTDRRSFNIRALAMAAALVLAIQPDACLGQLKPYPRRARAPSLDGAGQWINTAGPLELSDLRGKFVVLDFWTYCCINCMHILPELKKLERAYPDSIVVIGVHSAKFATERDAENIRQAVLRYEIEHPIVNDANLTLWRKFAVDVWPSLRVIDPEGNLVAYHSGEITFETLDEYFRRATASYRRRKLLDETPLRFDLELYAKHTSPLRFPGKVLADVPGGRLFIADSGHNRIVIASLNGALISVVGSGVAGSQDGHFAEASFDHPQGMALHDGQLYVADTENHLIRRVDFENQRVTTVAGKGIQARVVPRRAKTAPTGQPLASPWDLWVHEDQLYIAMAGLHQIWRMSLEERIIGPFAGNAVEDIIDGPLLPRQPYQPGFASFAQPSGLASNGQHLFVADSEGSSIRVVPFDVEGRVATLLGTAELPSNRLFTFGDRDGPVTQALLQHPIGLAFHQGSLYVADTYNNKVKRIEPGTVATVRTLAGGDDQTLDEPSGLSGAEDVLFVADTNHHRVCTIDLAGEPRVREFLIDGLERPTEKSVDYNYFGAVPEGDDLPLPSDTVTPVGGELRISIKLALPPGYKLNSQAPQSYAVQLAAAGVVAPELLNRPLRVEKPGVQLEIALPLETEQADTGMRLSLVFYYCKDGAEAVCKIGRVTWSGSLRIKGDGESGRLQLHHRVQ